MYWKRIPILPTLLVLLAVGVMVRLGFWQIGRMHEKEAALAAYSTAARDSQIVDLTADNPEKTLAFRRVAASCPHTSKVQLVAGRSHQGESGWAHVVVCNPFSRTFDVSQYYAIAIGWTKDMRTVEWDGGRFTGVLVPGHKNGVVLPNEGRTGDSVVSNLDYYIVADPPLAGLEANARPDPRNIPNNHWSYAIQWFLFALTALVIYGLALRKRIKQG